jgi:DNA-binding protein Fis
MNQVNLPKIQQVKNPSSETLKYHEVNPNFVSNESTVDHKSKYIRHLLYSPLNDVEAAKFLGVATQTLRNWKSGRKGPHIYKVITRSSWQSRVRKMLTLPSGDRRFDDCMDRFANIIISEALNFTDGNRSQSAELLGLSRPTLHSKTEKFGLELKTFIKEDTP